MWVDRTLYDDIRKKLWETAAVNQALEKQVTAQQSTIDWMAVRLTQVEHEKAQLLFNYTGVKIASPVLKQADESSVDLNQAPSFSDIGDAQAEKLGISWNDDGTIRYKS